MTAPMQPESGPVRVFTFYFIGPTREKAFALGGIVSERKAKFIYKLISKIDKSTRIYEVLVAIPIESLEEKVVPLEHHRVR